MSWEAEAAPGSEPVPHPHHGLSSVSASVVLLWILSSGTFSSLFFNFNSPPFSPEITSFTSTHRLVTFSAWPDINLVSTLCSSSSSSVSVGIAGSLHTDSGVFSFFIWLTLPQTLKVTIFRVQAFTFSLVLHCLQRSESAFILVVFWVQLIRRLWRKCGEQTKENDAPPTLSIKDKRKSSAVSGMFSGSAASGRTSGLFIPADPGSAFLQSPFRRSTEDLKVGCQVGCPDPSCSSRMIDAPLRHVNQVSWSRTDGLIDGIFNREHNRRWVPPLECCSSFGASICVSRFCLSSQSEPLRRVSLVFSCSRLCEPHNDHSALLVVELLFNSKPYSAAAWGRGSFTTTDRKTEDQLQVYEARKENPLQNVCGSDPNSHILDSVSQEREAASQSHIFAHHLWISDLSIQEINFTEPYSRMFHVNILLQEHSSSCR